MRQNIQIATLIAIAGATVPALAQDSISNAGGLPGDALTPWAQRSTAYIVDLSPIISTQGHVFGVGPLLKTNRIDPIPTFFNNLPSASSISPDLLEDVLFSRSTYSFWNTPGSGVNAEFNNPGQPFDASKSLGSQFSVVQGSFSFGFSGVVGAIVNFDPNDANRLYVDRNMAAVNRPSFGPGDGTASIGGYSIDADGNLYYRADDFFTAGPNNLTGNNWYRTRLSDRNGAVDNLISDLSAQLDATDRLLTNSATTHGPPNMMPASIVGGNGVVSGNNFNGEYVYGNASPLTADANFVDTTIGGSTRGKLSSTSFDILNAGPAHAQSNGQLVKAGAAGDTTVFNIHAVDSTGTRIAKKAFALPLTTDIVDNDDGFIINYTGLSPEFTNYRGAASFQGVGNIALGQDQNGLALMAATVREDLSPPGLITAEQVTVARYNAATDTTEWALAAWVDESAVLTANPKGKAIFDSNGIAIGQLVNLFEVSGNANHLSGTMMSAPTFDSAGNIWFMAAVELFDRLPGGVSDFDGAILRAIYDPATFSYRLDMVLEVGQQIDGLNSARKYRIDFLGSTLNNGTTAPSTIWSSSMAEGAWNNSDISGVAPSDPITNGGLIAATSITYDVNEDGLFDVLSGDESYQVAFYIGYFQDDVVNPCPAELTGDNPPNLNLQDIFAYLALFNNGDPAAELTGDNPVNLNLQDIFAYLASFNAGCP
ncbi:MAG: hypothetical protein JKY96_05545 [Phycisphaerales bacterium]|nr:hypothetical protein [Phycisphaerales bacterium]